MSIQKEKIQNKTIIAEKNKILTQRQNTIIEKIESIKTNQQNQNLQEFFLNLRDLKRQILSMDLMKITNEIAIHDNETELLNLQFANGLTSCKLSEQMLELIYTGFRDINDINFKFHEETFDVIVNMKDRKLKYTFGNDDMYIKMLDTIQILRDCCKTCDCRVIIKIGEEDQKETYCAVCDAHEMPFGPPKIIDDDKIQLDHDSRCRLVIEKVDENKIPENILQWKLSQKSIYTKCTICSAHGLIHAFSKKGSDVDVCFNCMIAVYDINYKNSIVHALLLEDY